MNKPFLQFVVLAWPFIMGWVLLALHFWARQISELRPVLTIKTFLADWALPIPTVSAVRIVITLLSGLFFAYPAFRNYSSIFPQNLRVAAFFDNEGIKKAIEQFDEKDLADFRLASNWSAEKEDYFEMIKSKLRESDIAAPSEFTFQDPTWHVFSKGSTTFVVNKAEGFQKYRIVSAKGLLEHCCEKEGETTYEFSSEFELLATSSNWITMTLSDIYLPKGWTYVLSPSFKQIYRNKKGKPCWDHTLVALTKVRFFPVPSIGQTLYLYRADPLSSYVPIGYAVYDKF